MVCVCVCVCGVGACVCVGVLYQVTGRANVTRFSSGLNDT